MAAMDEEYRIGNEPAKQKSEAEDGTKRLPSASCSVASYERKKHLINVIRTWLNRAEKYTEDGRMAKASDAIGYAAKALQLLEKAMPSNEQSSSTA